MPNAGLPSAPIPLVSASDEDGCPLRLRPLRPSPAAALPLPGLGTLPALPAAACAPDFLGTEPGWAAPARPLDLSTASMPAAALAAFVEWLPGLSQAAGALLLRPVISPVATSAGFVPALLTGMGSASIMTSRILLV